MLTVKTHTKAFTAFKAVARKTSQYRDSSIRSTGSYFTLNGGKRKHKDLYMSQIMPSAEFTHYAPNSCSVICLPDTNCVFDKVYSTKYTIRFILRINEATAGYCGPEHFFSVNAKYCSKNKVLTNVVVSKYNNSNKQWDLFAKRNAQITCSDLALFILHNNYANAQKRFSNSVNDYASYVARTGDYS